MTTTQRPGGPHTLGARLLTDLLARRPAENALVSPLSIFMALAAVANGAAGETLAAIASALGQPDATPADLNAICGRLWSQLDQLDIEAYEDRMYGGLTEPRVRAQLANGLWLNHTLPFVPAFADTVREVYRAEVSGADFGAPETADIIDRWVSEHTAGSIRQIAGDLDPLTSLVLINAITFKGGWASVFKPDRTEEAPFTLPDGSRAPCDLMQQAEQFYYAESDELQLVVLPFTGSRVGRTGGAFMLVVLPRPGRTPADALAHLGPNWMHWAMSRRLHTAEVRLALPRFRIAYEAELTAPLADLGMGLALEGRADFTNLTPVRPTYISQVKHKATLLVNEEGAEAAGGTMVKTMTLGATPEPVEMRVDRPFVCAIVAGKEWSPLFVGAINRPERIAAGGQ